MAEPPDELKQKIDEADIVKDVDVVLPTIIWSHRTGNALTCIMHLFMYYVCDDFDCII
jgi:hypothetical protein